MTAPLRSALLEGKRIVFAGLCEDDPYFRNVGDGIEPELHALCRRFMRDDYSVLDIGANIGVTALLMAQFVPNGSVLAIEAGPTVAGILSQNIERNGQKNVTVEHCAISDKNGEVSFVEDSAYGHIGGTGDKVKARRLETVLADHGLSRADFIKIDTEGFEPFILKDALDFINKHNSLVLFELNSWSLMATTGVVPVDFIKWVLSNFSQVFVVRRGKDEAGLLERIGPDEALKLLHFNLIQDGCVSDVLVTNAPDRLLLSPEHLSRQLAEAARLRDAAMIERDRAIEMRDEIMRDRDAIRQRADAERTRLKAIESSTAWKVTGPLRRLLARNL